MTPPRIRVLHVVRNLNDGGMERVVADLARWADPDVFDTHVMTLGRFGRFTRDVGPHSTLHRAPPMTKLSLLRPRALAAAIRDLAPLVVHTHSGTWYKVAQAARLARVPLVYTEHGRQYPDPWLNRQLDRRAASMTQRVVAVSDALGRYLVVQLGLRREQVTVITNGIDLGRLDVARRQTPTGAPRNGTVVFGTLGRIEPVKGYDVLLSALAQWPADAPPVKLLIAGDGSARGTLEALARRLNLGDRAQFLGWVEQTERFYPLLDVFVLSSLSEGTSISLLEAMASGCPPLVTNVGGNSEVLGRELGDWLVRPGDPTALRAKMVMAARSVTLRQRLGVIARGRVAAAYDLSQTAQRYAEVYRSVISRTHTLTSA